ncbi:MAG: hypothetical protein ABR528_14215 [Pseudonocardiaceae bacterium]
MGLTAVGSGMRRVDVVPGGRPIGVLLIVGVPRVGASGVGASGVAIATVALWLVATLVGPLLVDVLTVLVRPIKLACGAAVPVGVLPRVWAWGAVVVVVVRVGVVGVVVVCAGVVVVVVVPVGIGAVVPARVVRSFAMCGPACAHAQERQA